MTFSVQNSKHAKTGNWFPGLEWLRAVYIVFVVSMHLNLAQEFARASGSGDGITVFDLLLSQVFCTAVPGFLLIAVFLQAYRNPKWEAVSSHLIDTLFLYAFWVGGWIVWTHGRPQPGIQGAIQFLLKGGGWAFYFFAVLLIVHVISAIIRNASNSMLWLGLVCTIGIVTGGFLMMASKSQAWTAMETYWWPICFIPVPFAAHLLARKWPALKQNPDQFRLWLGVMAIISAGSACLEWLYAANAANYPQRPFLPEYLRLSPMSSALMSLLMALKVKNAPRWVCFLSRNSLGIFCLHVFILRGLHREISDWAGQSPWSTVATLIIILTGGGFAAEFVRRLFRERLV